MPQSPIGRPSTQFDLSSLVERFSNPPRDFSPVPIWWWSGDRLDRVRLRWQLERFAEGGVFNLIVLNLAPTSPLYGCDPDDPPFLSADWWQIFEDVCADAGELGVRLWFYDQIGFSGANLQGEVVREDPTLSGQWLESMVEQGDGPIEMVCPAEGMPLAASTTPVDGEGRPQGEASPLSFQDRRIVAGGTHRQRVRLVYAVHRGFDYFDRAACSRLMDRVHGEFERRVGRFFGDVIVGSFQDELPSLPSWGRNFATAFQARRGYDIVPHLPALWDGEGEKSDRVRVDYHQVRAGLAEEAFFRPLFDWHEGHGLICGFDQQGPARAGHPVATVHFYADYLQTHRWFTAPGSDHHGEAKIHSSLAHLYGRPRVWIESFHSSGWGGTLEETFDWLLPWLRAGANLYDPHAVYYSTRGGWWEWAPPSTCWRQPYWRHYALFANAVSRLCFLLSQGTHVCDLGVLFPTTTIQAGLAPDGGASPQAQAAHEIYQALLGSMFWSKMVPGVLDQDRRDFDVLDDDSVQRAEVGEGSLVIGDEAYRIVVLPACRVLRSGTAERLCRFVEKGGHLIAIGVLPQHAADGDAVAADTLQRLFDEGKATQVAEAEDLPQALAEFPRRVDASVPTLHRRIGGRDVVLIPAAFPYATQQQDRGSWLDVDYAFDPGRYQRPMQVTVRGVQGVPELWDPLSGERRRAAATDTDDGVVVEIPFADGPAALLVWPLAGENDGTLPPAPPSGKRTTLVELAGPWTSQIEQTLDNRFGDFTKPGSPGALPVQTWRFQHRVEGYGEDGLDAGWQRPAAGGEWSQVEATFGTYGWWVGPGPVDGLPEPLGRLTEGTDPLSVSGWQPAVYSLSRGIRKDPIHRGTLGPKGHVPEDFLLFGPARAGEGIQFRTTVWVPEATDAFLALGAPAGKQVWLNGRPVGESTPGFLWLAPVDLQAGLNLLEFRLAAEESLNLRGYWTLLRSPDRFGRPEWLTSSDEPVQHSLLRFSDRLEIPFLPVDATIQVGADAPCRVLVNDLEIGRQGGFDPYYSTMRIQPYQVPSLPQGSNHLVLEVQDLGKPVAIVVDGLVRGAQGQVLQWRSGPGWRVQRDDGGSTPVQLRRRQWVSSPMEVELDIFWDMDPAYTHLWRRPHPLPAATWLEDEAGSVASQTEPFEADQLSAGKDTVLPAVPDASAGRSPVQWLRWALPPGAVEMELPVAGQARVWVDGRELEVAAGHARLPDGGSASRVAVMRVEPARGRSGGSVLDGPITYSMAEGQIRLGPWSEQGLAAYSGGVRYRRTFRLEAQPADRVELDLGRVRGTAEVWINREPAGARIWSPYRFDISDAVRAGENAVEILVLNTLAPYLNAHSPTHYIFPGQAESGIYGPVQIVGTIL